MTRNKDVKRTFLACYSGAFTQAAVLNLPPLFYVIYNTKLGLSLSLIALLLTMVFGIQIFIDLAFSRVISKIGYKKAAVAANLFCVAGLIVLGLTPLFDQPQLSIVCSTLFSAIGAGMIEITTSPLLEALQTENKSAAMSLLHSFYCWGHFVIVIATTAFLWIFGQDKWFIMPLITAIVPLLSTCFYLSIGKIKTLEDQGCSNKFSDFGKNKTFVLLVLLMLCAGACEQNIAQWASYFAEKGLNVSKTLGDLWGTSLFALFMAVSRTLFGFVGKKISLKKSLLVCSIGLIFAYLITALSPLPFMSLAGLALCGLFVGIAWPGIISLPGESGLKGGTLMFALLSLGGDLGCTLGPTLVGELAAVLDINKGVLIGTAFPIIMCVLMIILIGQKPKTPNK